MESEKDPRAAGEPGSESGDGRTWDGMPLVGERQRVGLVMQMEAVGAMIGTSRKVAMKSTTKSRNHSNDAAAELVADEVREVSIAEIVVPEARARRLRDVMRLVTSLAQSKLIAPILLRRIRGQVGLVLIAGRHRLEAHRVLGRETILARIVEVTDLEAELLELDENLARIELTVLERGEHLLRRKEIYEELHPEVKHGGAPGKSGGGKRAKDATVASFAEDTFAKTGLSVRTIQDDVKIARLPADARKVISGTPIEDQKRVLLQLTRIAPEKQTAIAEALASGRCRTVRQAAIELGVENKPRPRGQCGDIRARMREVAQPLREARRRWGRVVQELDPARTSEAQVIGEEIAALEQKIEALVKATGTVAAASQNDNVASARMNAGEAANDGKTAVTSELAAPPRDVHRPLADQKDGPQADVAAAVAAAIDLQKIAIADEGLEITGLGLEELREGEALVRSLADMATTIAKLGHATRSRTRDTSRRQLIVPDSVKAAQRILPAGNALAQHNRDVLRAWEAFASARTYLRKIEPALELAYNQHAPMRADDPASAAVFDAINRYMNHGHAFVAGEYTFVRHLEAHGVPSAFFRGAMAAFSDGVTESTRRLFASFGEMLKRPPSPAENASAMSRIIHGELLRASGFDPSTYVAGATAAESGKNTIAGPPAKRNGAADADARVAPAPSPASSVSEKPTAEQRAESDEIVHRYYRSMVPPEGVLAEVRKKNWPLQLKERVCTKITKGWEIATAPFPPQPRAA